MPVTFHPLPKDVQEFVERLADKMARADAPEATAFYFALCDAALDLLGEEEVGEDAKARACAHFIQLILSAGLPSESAQ